MRLALEGFTGGSRSVAFGLPIADDTVLIDGSASELQDLVARVQSASTEMGLLINVKKRAVMSLNAEEQPVVSIYGEPVQIVHSFKYLGVIFTEEASGESEIQARLNQGYAKLATLNPTEGRPS